MPSRLPRENEVGAPPRVLRTATLSDTADLPAPGVTRCIDFNAAGTVSLIAVDDENPVDYTVVVGQRLWVRARRIRVTGTSLTAGQIICGY
jgi:hypothetical protein